MPKAAGEYDVVGCLAACVIGAVVVLGLSLLVGLAILVIRTVGGF
jgi:hypothetical protein